MTATSVQGLFNNGAGAVDGSNKGSERMTLGVGHLIGPRVIAAGQADNITSPETITFAQPLSGSESNHVIQLTNNGATNAVSVGTKTDNADNDFVSFTIVGTDNDEVMWTIIKTS